MDFRDCSLPCRTAAIDAIITAQVVTVTTVILDNARGWRGQRENRVLLTLQAFAQYALRAYFTPLARLHLTDVIARMVQPEVAWAQMCHIIESKLYPAYQSPCEVCFYPTGSWCEQCDDVDSVICRSCENLGSVCRRCAPMRDL
jgi:hypothetical protein